MSHAVISGARGAFGSLLNALRGPRFWMLFANLVTRGAGFVTSFALARLGGPQALGIYSSVVTTASSVVSPFSGVMANNATVMAVDAHRAGPAQYGASGRGNLLVALLLSGISFGAFFGLSHIALQEGRQGAGVWMLAGAASVIVGQVCASVVQGFYHGAGAFVASARVFALVAGAVVIGVGPILWLAGLRGAFGLLIVTSLAPILLLAPRVVAGGTFSVPRSVWLEVGRRLLAGLPSVAATSVNSAVNWLCAIYFVQQVYGLSGVGVIAVATQWLTLMLMPATSWGGVTLKTLAEVVSTGDVAATRRAVGTLIRKNVLVTFILAALIGACSHLIARAYGLRGTGVGVLLLVNGGVSIVAAVNNVFERLLLCLNRQSVWFVLSLLAFLVQVCLTKLLIGVGLVMVAFGVLSAGVTLAVLCWLAMGYLLEGNKRRLERAA